MAALWFLSGPPLGEGIYRGVIQKVGRGEARPLLSEQHPTDGWRERGAALADDLRKAGDVVLFAHGLAVPAAIAAAQLQAPRLLILSNGPIRRLDPVAAALSGLAATPGGRFVLGDLLFQPPLWLRYLSSSAGLRRTVVNPYVMDRDTVATLALPGIQRRAGRQALTSYLRSLRAGLPDVRGLPSSTYAIWGDSDPLYPAYEADFLDASLGGGHHLPILGGQHFHPEERPWELAEQLETLLRREGLQGSP
jgi:hypothetical protein